VFAGGGARGAYQVRVLRGLLDLGLLRGDSGVLRAFAIPAKNLYTANGVFFVDARSDVPLWQRGRFSVERTRIRVEHPMASSAIPVFFPSVEIEGRHFGDGSIRASRSAESTCCGSRHRAGSRRSPRKSPTPSRPWSATAPAPASEQLREPVPGSGE